MTLDLYINEALFLNTEEKNTLSVLMSNIREELTNDGDGVQDDIIRDYIQLILDYCNRFYARQFKEMTAGGSDILARFQQVLIDYYEQGKQRQEGLPSVKYCADMSKVTAECYFGSEDTQAQRMEKRRSIAAQRTEDYRTGTYKRAGGVMDPLPEDAPQFLKDYHAYYKCPRGYHERSGNSTDGWNIIGTQSFLNQPLLAFAHEIETPVLLIHGEKAHSRYFSEYAFEKMTGQHVEGESKTVGNKELLIIPGASHVDFYDDVAGVISYDKIEKFFATNLK